MAYDPNQFYTQTVDPLQGLDPATLEAIKRGQSAQGELKALQEGAPMAQALRLANAQLGGVQGQGHSATAPTLLDAIGVLGQQYVGNQRLKEMQQQAAALRGDVSSGKNAAMDAEFQRGAYDDEQRRLNAQAQMEHQTKLAQDAQQARADLSAQQQKDREALERLKASLTKDEKETAAQVPTQYREPYRLAVGMINNANRIKAEANNLTEDDIKAMNNPVLRTALVTLSPNAVKNLANQEGLNLTENGTRFLNALNGLSAEQRHQLFGTQVTRGEEGISVSVLPNASDLTLDSMMYRVDENAEKALNDIRSMEDATLGIGGKRPNLIGNLKYDRWQSKGTADDRLKNVDDRIRQIAEERGLNFDDLIRGSVPSGPMK